MFLLIYFFKHYVFQKQRALYATQDLLAKLAEEIQLPQIKCCISRMHPSLLINSLELFKHYQNMKQV